MGEAVDDDDGWGVPPPPTGPPLSPTVPPAWPARTDHHQPPGPPRPTVSPGRWTALMVAALVAFLLLGTGALVAGVVAVTSSPPCGAFAHTGSCTEEESADIERDFQVATLATGVLGALTLVAGVVLVVAIVRVVRVSRAEARARGQAR